MAATRVQGAEGFTTSNVTSFGKAFASNVTVHSALTVDVSWDATNTQVVAISDTRGNTWHQVGSTLFDATQKLCLASFYCFDTAAGANTVTATFNSGASTARDIDIYVTEFSNATKLGALDGSATATGTSSTTASPGSWTAAAPLVVCSVVLPLGAVGSVTAGTGYTIEANAANFLANEYSLTRTAGTISPSFTFGSGATYLAVGYALTTPATGGGSAALSDSVPVATSLARTSGATPRAAADSVPVATSLVRSAVSAVRALADSIGVSGVLARAFVAARNLADTVGLSTSPSRTSTKARALADSVPLATSLAAASGGTSRSLADGVPVASALGRAQGVQGRASTDVLPVASSLGRAQGVKVRAAADSVALTGVLTRAGVSAGRALADGAAVSTSLSVAFTPVSTTGRLSGGSRGASRFVAAVGSTGRLAGGSVVSRRLTGGP